MSDAVMVSADQAVWRPAVNPWLIAVTVSLAAFMEVLDTAIANVALPHIAGNLGASNDQSTWVLTSYLVANAIVLPITGWLVSLFGRKRFWPIRSHRRSEAWHFLFMALRQSVLRPLDPP